MDREELKERLAIHEGSRLKAYLDTVGVLTVGIGHNCEASPVPGVTKPGDVISEETEQQLFDADIDVVVAQMDKRLPWWSTLDDARQNVLADMGFNMGIGGLCTFVNTLACVESGDYEGAAEGMLKSKWARQVGNRAEYLADVMKTGVL